MLKRFYSKRSGFTLVEIIIAFAVFAIMASMICQILQLSVAARRSNNIYQRELAEQEAVLTVVQKQNDDFKSEAGKIALDFGGKKVEIPYAMLSAKQGADAGEGLNYFVGKVNYGASGEIPIEDTDTETVGNTTGSQASRMDTRITGTANIGAILFYDVIKDTHAYDTDDEYKVPDGHTRYYFRIAVNGDAMEAEDVPYAQMRLFFYDDVALDPLKRNTKFTEDKKTFTKDFHKALKIADVGYVSTKDLAKIVSDGLSSSYVYDDYQSAGQLNNYTLERMENNCIRIGTPFNSYAAEVSGMGNRGLRFAQSNVMCFYVDFENVEVPELDADGNVVKNADGTDKIKVSDVTLTASSFGNNVSVSDSGTATYKACPVYKNEYKSDGTPKYNEESKSYVNIYGAYLYTRHYEEGGA